MNLTSTITRLQENHDVLMASNERVMAKNKQADLLYEKMIAKLDELHNCHEDQRDAIGLELKQIGDERLELLEELNELMKQETKLIQGISIDDLLDDVK